MATAAASFPSRAQRPAASWPLRALSCAGWLIWNAPRNLLVVALKLYRRLISPLYGPVCRFFPTCSAYALEAVTVYGAVKGSWLAARRLLRCHPWNAGGIDPVPAHDHGDDPALVPYIVQLNHPDRYLAAQSDAEGRTAA